MKKIFFGLVLVAALGVIFTPRPTHAVTGADFNPGYIIDDAIFYNENALSATAVQSFLNSQVTSCDTNGTKPASEYGRPDITRAQYAASRGWQSAPYTCLRDYTQNTPQMEAASGYCGALPAASGQSSAQIITSIAKACHINPQVLLVLLQKEQSLVTDTWPLNSQYKNATGFACPDTAPCDPAYGGFFYQVYYAARQFQVYKARPNSYNYVAGRTNSIYLHPDLSRCGSTQVYIRNQATAALYIYTPYQPNSAALNNLYGTGDSCSSYGNRNFWRLFNDWFGPTIGPAYKSDFFAQSSTNISLYSGETQYIWVKFKNTGWASWGDDVSASAYNPLHLATDGPINRASVFSTGWPSNNRPNLTFEKVYNSDGMTVSSNQHVVDPGQIAEYKIPITALNSSAVGSYIESFSPIREGAADWWLGPTFSVNVTIKPTYNATHYSQSSYTSLHENDAKMVYFSYKNTGNAPWYDDASVPQGTNPIHLATTNPINTPNNLGESWPRNNRPALNFTAVYEADGVTLASNQHVVQPGQIGKFEFAISNMMGTNQVNNILAVQPIVEGSPNWDMSASSWIQINTIQSNPSATYFSQSGWPTLNKGDSSSLNFMYKNTGQSTWRGDLSNIKGIMPIHLATTGPINRSSIFASSWTNSNRPALNFTAVYEADGVTLASNQHVVQPGQIGKFEFAITVPLNAASGEYIERFQPIAEGAPGTRWNIGGEVFIKITIR